jgi:hypothetical protein
VSRPQSRGLEWPDQAALLAVFRELISEAPGQFDPRTEDLSRNDRLGFHACHRFT